MPEGFPQSGEPVPVRQLSDQFDGEWLLIKVLDTSAPAGDALGELLAHSPEWSEVFRANRKIRKREPTAPLWILQGGTKFGDGDALRRSLARVAAEEEWTSVNSW
jgi:hypothetical protein